MHARNADEYGSVPEGSPRAEHGNRDRRLRELDWKSPPSIKLPRTSFGRMNRAQAQATRGEG
jgi:hypothetical protein